MNRDAEIKIFTGSTSKNFSQAICAHLGAELGKSETITFSDGNIFVRALETVRDKDIYLVQSIALMPNDEFVEILFWIDAFKRANANSVTVVMPYFGYAKGDKKDEPRVSIRARVCADAIEASGADRVVTMDLHSPQIQGFFKVPVDHLYALPVLCREITRLNLPDMVVVSPDAGFAKQARLFADRLHTPVAIGDKHRVGHDEQAEVLEIIGHVEGKTAVIVDDFTISCGTLANLAKGLKERGAQRIIAAVSHNLLSARGKEILEYSEIDKLVVTDTVSNPNTNGCAKIITASAAPLFAETIRRIHYRESVSELFD